METGQNHFFLIFLIWLDWKCIYLLNMSNNEGLSRMDRQVIDQNEICALFVGFNKFLPPLPGEVIS